jgi:YVTN family beta-propeller protein
VKTIAVGNRPRSIAFNPNTNTVYVATIGIGIAEKDHDIVSVIDVDTNKVLANIIVGKHPSAVDVNPKTNMIYVANTLSNTLSVIDGDTNKVLANVTVGSNPTDVTVNPKTNIVYVANKFSDHASIIDGTTNKVTTTPVGLNSFAVAVNPETNMAYVTNYDSNTVSVINGTTNKVVVGVAFNTNPPNAGDISCNGQKISKNYTRYNIDTVLECEAIANSGFAFSSWSGGLSSNLNNSPETKFTVTKYGTLTANFITPVQVSIPTEALLGIIVSPIVGW